MRVGVPREVKNHEYRVAITPVGVHELVEHGHEVFIERGAVVGSSIPGQEYEASGAKLLGSADEVWGNADMVLKVKEPVAEEYHRLREGLVLFTYLHLAADRPLTEELIRTKVTGIAYEAVQLPSGGLPLLYPMSEVAGCLAPQVGAHSLLKAQGGRGVLMGGVGGVANAKVVIIGAGVSGQNAANITLGMGADVTLLDTDLDKLRMSFWRYNNRVHGLASSKLAIRQQVLEADMVIGAVLIPGAKAPKLVTNDLVAEMKPGSVLVDIAVDQGGCFEDTHPTTHADPTFQVHNSTFYCVANMPGAVPNTSTYALTNATLRTAGPHISPALRTDLYVMQAKAFAGMKAVTDAHRCMTLAEQAAARIRREDEPPETEYMQPGLVEAQLAEALISLGDLAAAHEYAAEAVRTHTHARGRVHRMATPATVELFKHLDHFLIRQRPVALCAAVNDQHEVLLLWRHRFIPDTWGWELPAGVVDDNETVEQAAAREMLEETGWRPGQLQHLITVEPSNGLSDAQHHVYWTDTAEYVDEPEDDFESEKREWIPLARIPGMVAGGEIRSANAVAALLLLHHRLPR